MINFFKKIKFKIKEYWVTFLIKFGLFLNSPFLVALGLAASASVIGKKGKYRVLAMGRSIFTDDLKAMVEFSGQIEYYVIHLGYWEFIFNHFSTAEERKGLEEANYHVVDVCKEGKKKYYEFLKKVFPYLQKFICFDTVISGNFSYVVQQELMKICNKKNIPFVVLFKEGLGAAEGIKNTLRLYKDFDFKGVKVLLYNEKIKRMLLDLDTIRLSENQIEIVGIPRLDCYFRRKKLDISNKQIVFFSFWVDKYPHFISDKKKLIEAEKRTEEFHKLIMHFALQHKDIKVVIKTKAAKHYFDFVKKILSDNFPDNIDNLIITNSGNPFNLIIDSNVIIGLQSTTLIEALAADKIIISPYFDDLIDDKTWNYFTNFPRVINYAKNEKDLEDYVLRPEKLLRDQKEKDDFLKEFIWLPDGQASVRAEAAIIRTIKDN